jgi:nucleotide-binding universal stress UspA family protein
MASRDMLVVVDNTEAVARLMAAAGALARTLDARLVGLFATGSLASAAYGDLDGWVQLAEAYQEAQRGEASAAEAAFRQELARRRLDGDWLYREADASEAAIALAPLYDLVVAGQPDPEATPADLRGVHPGSLALGSGRPVLVVPYAGTFENAGKRVLVAWNASREATRALHDAMPILQHAEAVTVIEIGASAPDWGVSLASAAEIAQMLTRRGISATAESEPAGDIAVDELLLSRAADLSADLLVMGAWGHSRLREYVMGGASRGILRSMTLPVLMSH